MKKCVLPLLICLALLCSMTAYAVDMRAYYGTPTLTFDGTTAICTYQFSSQGDTIAVTMNLWNGDTLVKSWTEVGQDVVRVSKTCTVSRGKTYVLEVSGAYGSSLFGPFTISQNSV